MKNNDINDNDIEILERRNQQIQLLQAQSLQFKEQMMNLLQTQEEDEHILISPIPYQSYDLPHQFKGTNTNSKFKQSYHERTSKKKGHQINYVNPQILKTNQSPLSTSFSTISKTSRYEMKQNQTQKNNQNDSLKNNKYHGLISCNTYYQQMLKNQNNIKKSNNNKSDINIKIKTQECSSKKSIHQKSEINKNHLQQQKQQSEFDKWYNSQTKWLKQTEEKIYKQKLAKELVQQQEAICTFQPEISNESKQLCFQKYKNIGHQERQQQYKEETQIRKMQRQLQEQEDLQISKQRMSPMTRKILKSVSPKLNHSLNQIQYHY